MTRRPTAAERRVLEAFAKADDGLLTDGAARIVEQRHPWAFITCWERGWITLSERPCGVAITFGGRAALTRRARRRTRRCAPRDAGGATMTDAERSFVCDCQCACGVGVQGEGEVCGACADGGCVDPDCIDDCCYTEWVAGFVRCRVCNHRQVSVVPVPPGLMDLECSHCGAMACDAEEMNQ